MSKYLVTFVSVEVEADSVEDATREASKLVAEDYEFFVMDVELDEGEENE